MAWPTFTANHITLGYNRLAAQRLDPCSHCRPPSPRPRCRSPGSRPRCRPPSPRPRCRPPCASSSAKSPPEGQGQREREACEARSVPHRSLDWARGSSIIKQHKPDTVSAPHLGPVLSRALTSTVLLFMSLSLSLSLPYRYTQTHTRQPPSRPCDTATRGMPPSSVPLTPSQEIGGLSHELELQFLPAWQRAGELS